MDEGIKNASMSRTVASQFFENWAVDQKSKWKNV